MSDIPVEIPSGDAGASSDNFDSLDSTYQELLSPPDEQIQVSRKQLEKLYGEHKSYRQKWGPVAQEWKGVPEEDVKGIASFYRALASGDKAQVTQAREWINSVIDGLSPAEEKAVNDAIKAEAKATGQTQAEVKAELTPDDIERIIEERTNKALSAYDQRKAQDAAVQANVKMMQEQAATLAAEHGIEAWATPGSRLYGMLMMATNEAFDQTGDLKSAMQKAALSILEDLQGVNAAIVSKKKATAGAGAKPSAGARGSEPASGRDKPSDWANARASALERMMAADFGR